MPRLYLVSACLVGANTRYDGTGCQNPELTRLVVEGKAIPICPEQLGGLPTPRHPCEIIGGNGQDVLAGQARVINSAGADVTHCFIRGAVESLRLAHKWHVQGAILKARSPSCSLGQIYDGSFGGKLKPGSGVTAAILEEAGFTLYDENSWEDNLP